MNWRWLKQALTQSLDVKPRFLDTPIQKLRWYTKNGLFGFNTAVQKTDHIEANKTQKVIVSSPIDAQPQLTRTHDDQWKIILPLKVVYESDKSKLTQLVNFNFSLGWKITSDLGVVQMITSPSAASAPRKTVTTSSHNADIISSQAKQQIEATQEIQPNNTRQQAQSPTQHMPSLADINCDYKIPAESTKIDQALVLSWAEHAATQSFDFNSESIDTQLQKLQSCYTEKGWVEFTTALHKSGNLQAIKAFKLTMSSQRDGQVQLIEAKDNQWKITLPLKIVYQNDKEKVTQSLNINLTVGRKISGDLGIMQIIATLGAAPPPELPPS